MVKEENINVVARVRPFSEWIENGKQQSCLQLGSSTSSITINAATSKEKKYELNRIFNEATEQETIFSEVGETIVDDFVNGINGTIFAYGQTGSGKTYTMLGPDGDEASANRGIIPRAVEAIFDALNAEKAEKGPDCFKFSMKCSFLELYNERLFDLLQENDATVKIQSCLEQITVVGAAEFEVTTPEECLYQLWRGWAQRKVAETSMNRESSRSHAIFMLTLVTEHFEGEVINRRSSRLNLVDLAGSERQGQTNNAGQRLREAGSINKSLSHLARVIRTLAEAKPNQFVPYRDSLLTHLLRDSLGGNARTTVVVNIHPNARFAGDTVSTLQFAESVKKVKNTATVNEAVTCKDIESWQAEILRVRQENKNLISVQTVMEKEKLNLLAENQQQKATIETLNAQINSYLSRSGRRMGFAALLEQDPDNTVPGKINFDDDDANSSTDISTAQRKHRRQTMFISNPLPPPSISDLQQKLAKAEKDLEEEEKALEKSEVEVNKLYQVVIEQNQLIQELQSSASEKVKQIREQEQKLDQLENDISSYLQKIADLEACRRRDVESIIELREEVYSLDTQLVVVEADFKDKMNKMIVEMSKSNEEWNTMRLEKLELEKQRDEAEKELAVYTGHNNHAQKIHHLEKMKTEMASLKNENAKLKSVMKAKGISLTEKDKENKTPTLNYRW